MKAINFKQVNSVHGVGQKEYELLPTHKTDDGIVTSCYKLSLTERLKVLFTGRVWLRIMTFNELLQPQLLTVVNPVMGEAIDRD